MHGIGHVWGHIIQGVHAGHSQEQIMKLSTMVQYHITFIKPLPYLFSNTWYDDASTSIASNLESMHAFRQISTAFEGCGCRFNFIFFKCKSMTDILGISCEIALKWVPHNLTDDKATLFQVTVWRSQCWPVSISPWRHLPTINLGKFSLHVNAYTKISLTKS